VLVRWDQLRVQRLVMSIGELYLFYVLLPSSSQHVNSGDCLQYDYQNCSALLYTPTKCTHEQLFNLRGCLFFRFHFRFNILCVFWGVSFVNFVLCSVKFLKRLAGKIVSEAINFVLSGA